MKHVGLVLLVVASGCRTRGDADAGAAAQPVKPAPLLTAPSTLSLFEPRDAACEWRQVDPVGGQTVVLASFPGSCVGAKVAFSPDATRAVVWFDPDHVQTATYWSRGSSKPGYEDEKRDPKATPRAFVVSTERRTIEPLPLPAVPQGTLDELGVDARGAVFALLEERVPEAAEQAGSITRDGETFDLTLDSEGIPVLVHAFRREGATWKRVETKVSTTGWDYALGITALDTFRTLGPRSTKLADPHAQGDSVEGEALTALAPLAPPKAGPDDGRWIFIGVGDTRVYVWEVQAEFVYTTGLLAAGTPPKPLPDLGFTDGELVALRSSGPWLLVTASSVGAHPRLYQFPQGRPVFRSDSARAVTFWPTTARPTHHDE